MIEIVAITVSIFGLIYAVFSAVRWTSRYRPAWYGYTLSLDKTGAIYLEQTRKALEQIPLQQGDHVVITVRYKDASGVENEYLLDPDSEDSIRNLLAAMKEEREQSAVTR